MNDELHALPFARNAAERFADNAKDQDPLLRAKARVRRLSDDGPSWEFLGLALFAEGEHRDAVAALETATTLAPLSPESRVCLAHAYGRIGRRNLSRDLLLLLAADRHLPFNLLLQVAVGLDAIDRPSLSMNVCREAQKRDPHHPQPYYDMAYYAARVGYPANVTESLARRAIALDPANVCYRMGLVSLLLKLKRESEALQIARELTPGQIASVRCGNCLRRVIELFAHAGDDSRAEVCRRRLAALRSSPSASRTQSEEC